MELIKGMSYDENAVSGVPICRLQLEGLSMLEELEECDVGECLSRGQKMNGVSKKRKNADVGHLKESKKLKTCRNTPSAEARTASGENTSVEYQNRIVLGHLDSESVDKRTETPCEQKSEGVRSKKKDLAKMKSLESWLTYEAQDKVLENLKIRLNEWIPLVNEVCHLLRTRKVTGFSSSLDESRSECCLVLLVILSQSAQISCDSL